MRKMTAPSKWSFLKSFLYCIILISLSLSAYIAFEQLRPATNPDDRMPLSKFIIDKWEPAKHIPEEIREIQFINENKIWYDIVRTNDGYEEQGTYQFTSDSTIQVQGRRDATIREWRLRRVAEKLEICYSENRCITYEREKIKWWWIIVTLASVVLAFYLLKKFTVSGASQSSI